MYGCTSSGAVTQWYNIMENLFEEDMLDEEKNNPLAILERTIMLNEAGKNTMKEDPERLVHIEDERKLERTENMEEMWARMMTLRMQSNDTVSALSWWMQMEPNPTVKRGWLENLEREKLGGLNSGAMGLGLESIVLPLWSQETHRHMPYYQGLPLDLQPSK